jgi:tRNA pseudouridine55 synthase
MTLQADHTRLSGEEGRVLLVDKPLHWTSFDVVRRVRIALDVKKVGHAGTLDPRATGLLIVCTGKETKSFDRYAGLEKEYTGTFRLGIQTPSFDLETAVTENRDSTGVGLDQLLEVVNQFRGKQLQIPPMYSAVKHKGRPLYEIARKGKTVEREPKEVEVSEFEILAFTPPEVDFRIVCSKGTYIRSLVHDVGIRLGCGAVLTALRRTRIGTFSVRDAITVEQLDDLHIEARSERQPGDDNSIPT